MCLGIFKKGKDMLSVAVLFHFSVRLSSLTTNDWPCSSNIWNHLTVTEEGEKREETALVIILLAARPFSFLLSSSSSLCVCFVCFPEGRETNNKTHTLFKYLVTTKTYGFTGTVNSVLFSVDQRHNKKGGGRRRLYFYCEQDTHTGGGVHMCKMSQILFSTIWFLYIASLSILQWSSV